MRIIGLLVGLVFRSFFQTGEIGFRKAHIIAKIVFLVTALSIFIFCGKYTTLAILLVIVLLGAIGYGVWWSISSYTLSSIPGLWYAGTALILSYLNLSPIVTPLDAIWIYVRATTLSLVIIFVGAAISPVQLSNMLHHFSKQAPIMIYLTWRIMPYGLKEMTESLIIGDLKGEKASTRLAPAIASLLETGIRIKEANPFRLETTPKQKIPYTCSVKYTFLLLVASIIILSAYMIIG